MSPARRVKVTSPQTRIALSRRHRPNQHLLPVPAPDDIAAARKVHERQLRVAVRSIALLGAVLLGGSGLIAAFPALDHVRVLGIPVSWLLVVVLMHPLLLGIAITHVRSAERVERDG